MQDNIFVNEFNPEPSDVALCGSMKHKVHWIELIEQLREKGISVSTPDMSEKSVDWDAMSEQEVVRKKGRFVRRHFANIATAKCVLVCNYDKGEIENYVGTNSLMEATVGFAYGKPLFLFNAVPNQDSREEILALEPRVLHGDLEKLIGWLKS